MKCASCNKNDAPIHPQYGPLWCNECNVSKEKTKYANYHEFVPDRIKEDRKANFNSLLQPYRGGEITKEFIEAHPKQAKKMIAEGHVTERQVKNAKYGWRDLPGWANRGRSK